MPATNAYAIFCEGLREEASGQATYVGVFRGQITPDRFPYRIARLHVVIVLEDEKGIDGKTIAVDFHMPGSEEPLSAVFPTHPVSQEASGDVQKASTRIEIQNIFEEIDLSGPSQIRLEVLLDGKLLLTQLMTVAAPA